METTSPTAHVCPDCAARMEQLDGLVCQLEDENRNLRLLEEALRRNRAWFAAVLANNANGVTLTGPGRRILRVVRALTGVVPGEVPGALLESLLVPEDQHILVECYRDLLERRCGQAKFEVRALRPDGSIQYLAGVLTDQLDNPDVQAIVCNYSDVTRSKRMELTLAEFAALAENPDYSVFTGSTEGQVLTWNEGARRMFGYTEEEMVGRQIEMLVPEELRAEEQAARQLTVETGIARERSTTWLCNDGTRIPVRISVSLIRDSYGRQCGVLNRCQRMTL